MTKLRLPDRASSPFVVAAACVWLGVVAGVRSPWWAAGAAAVASPAFVKRRWFVSGCLAVVAVGAVSGALLTQRASAAADSLPTGRVTVRVEVVRNGSLGRWGGQVEVVPRAIARGGGFVFWNGPGGRLRGQGVEAWEVGSRWEVTTSMRAVPGAKPWSTVTWNGGAESVTPVHGERTIIERSAGAARARILDVLEPGRSEARALVAGFLIGDLTELGDLGREQMRRAGLSHYVAVSGSNVALFLMALFAIAGPLGWGVRRRAVVGLVGLVFFVTLIGPDPSVIRAAAMAAIVLVAHVFGLRPPIWTVIGVGVSGLLLVAPQLAFSLGFQLSVAATAGVIAGSAMFEHVRPRWVGAALGASIAAQVTVAPILLMAVGTVPMWAPAANVIAAPFVVVATMTGGAGTILGVELLVVIAEVAAGVVLVIARIVAPLPQLGIGGIAVVAALGLALGVARLRPLTVVVAVGFVGAASVPWSGMTVGPALVVLDVGQGDAIVLIGQANEVVLVDGGQSGVALLDGLARHGIESIDLLVVTHAHLDHYGGLGDLIDRIPVAGLWYAPSPDQSGAFESLLEAASASTDISTPVIGRYRVGSIGLEVLGPVRRYGSVNDQSIVITARIGEASILLTGDVEEIAQRDIAPPRVSILKIPHHGATTSDRDWLAATGASLAVVSVGDNSFGHPSPALLEVLRAAGMMIRRTDVEGDVVISLSSQAFRRGFRFGSGFSTASYTNVQSVAATIAWTAGLRCAARFEVTDIQC